MLPDDVSIFFWQRLYSRCCSPKEKFGKMSSISLCEILTSLPSYPPPSIYIYNIPWMSVLSEDIRTRLLGILGIRVVAPSLELLSRSAHILLDIYFKSSNRMIKEMPYNLTFNRKLFPRWQMLFVFYHRILKPPTKRIIPTYLIFEGNKKPERVCL